MGIIDKLKLYSSKKECCYSNCTEGEKKCTTTTFVLCWLKKILTVFVSLIIISPLLYFFIAPKVIHKYLLNNPEAIIESVQKYSEKKQKEMQEGAVQKIEEVYNSAKFNSSLPFVGNKNGSHILVVFYDYACGYCKKTANELKALSKKDPELKIILKDLPLFGNSSASAAKASIYVYEKYPAKFEEFHYKLILTKDINETTINAVAKSIGITSDVVKESKNSYENQLRANYVEAGEIRIDGTPATIINGKLVLGYKSADEIASLLK